MSVGLANEWILGPCAPVGVGVVTSFGATNLTANNLRFANIFQAKDATPITHGIFRQGTVIGTSPVYRISLQALSSGFPDNTVLGGGSPVSATFTPTSADDGLVLRKQFDNPYTPTAGQFLAVVVDYSSGSIDGSNRLAVSTANNAASVGFLVQPVPFAATYNGSAWTVVSGLPFGGYATASDRVGVLVQGHGTQSITTSGHRIAAKFNLSRTLGRRVVVDAIRMALTKPTSGTPTFAIWNAGSVVASLAVPYENLGSATAGFKTVTLGAVTLETGVDYYAGIEADGNALTTQQWTFGEENDKLAHPSGTGVKYSQFDGSSWTDTDTATPLIWLRTSSLTPRLTRQPRMQVIQ